MTRTEALENPGSRSRKVTGRNNGRQSERRSLRKARLWAPILGLKVRTDHQKPTIRAKPTRSIAMEQNNANEEWCQNVADHFVWAFVMET